MRLGRLLAKYYETWEDEWPSKIPYNLSIWDPFLNSE